MTVRSDPATGRTARAPARRRPILLGRAAEIEELVSSPLGLSVLIGEAGVGRSAVLGHVAERLTAEGHVVLQVAGRDAPPWDRYGAVCVLGAVRDRFEAFTANADLARALGALDRLATSASYTSPDGRAALLTEIGRLMRCLGSAAVLLIDDADRLERPIHVAVDARSAGHSVIAAIRADNIWTGASWTAAGEFRDLADTVVVLNQLAPRRAAELLERRAGRPLAPAVFDSVAAALGTLAGNPAALVGAYVELTTNAGLTEVYGQLCPTSPDVAVVLPSDHPAMVTVDELGPPAHEVLLMAGGVPLALDALTVLSHVGSPSTRHYGDVADTLVTSGLVDISTGRLVVTVPAVTTTLIRRFGHRAGQLLHVDLLRTLRALADGTVTLPLTALADHVVAAGAALEPDPSLVGLLIAAATDVERRDPELAAARYGAARRHAPPGERRDELTAALLDLLLRTGRHHDLAALMEELVAEGEPRDDDCRVRLATLTALAALHIGRPVAPAVRDALGGRSGQACPLRLAERWFAARRVGVEDIAAAFRVLPVLDGSVEAETTALTETRQLATLEESVMLRDVVPVFTALFPSVYRPPRNGVAAQVRRVVVGHPGVGWPDAVAAARELVVSGDGDAMTRSLVTFFAAEILAWQGQRRFARQWLASVEGGTVEMAYRSWLEYSMGDDGNDVDVVLRSGWELYDISQSTGGTGSGWRLLMRMCVLAVEREDARWRRRLADEVRSRPTLGHDELISSYAAALEALLSGELHGVSKALDLLYARGQRIDVAFLCLAIGLVAERPTPWFLRGWAIAQEADAKLLLARFKAAMARRGVRLPRASSSSGLGSTEREIVELVRQGLTNRRIAAALHLSVKTVENHLTKVFAKVGCTSRYELAAANVDGLLDDTVA